MVLVSGQTSYSCYIKINGGINVTNTHKIYAYVTLYVCCCEKARER